MGTVYEAYQESMRRKVALKVLDAGVLPSGNEASRFEREAWIGGRLSHPNIVKVYGQGTMGATHYIAMELIEGRSLHDLIREAKERRANHPELDSTRGTEHIRQMVELFVGLAGALQHVHESGIVHRDIKPANLLLPQDDSRLMLTDFGLARDEEASRMTRRGDFMGTIRYMSPEQLLANRVKIDNRSDIYSLGVSLYEALTFDLPYSADSEEAYISAIGTKDPVRARSRSRAVPRDIETILMKCLERDPERRYTSAAELRSDLTLYLEDRPVKARRPGVIIKSGSFVKRHRGVFGGAVLAVLLASAGLTYQTRRVEYQNQLRRIRWTLEQAIATGRDPEVLQSDWGDARMLLRDEVQRHPLGAIALLAHRAGTQVSVTLDPSFGLVSAPPSLTLSVAPIAELGTGTVFVGEIEGAWDSGAWRPVGWIASRWCSSPAEGYTDEHLASSCSNGLDDILSSDELSAVPHHLDLRANFTILRCASALESTVIPSRNGTDCGFGPIPARWLSAQGDSEIFRETRVLEPLSINLFREFPPDFPRRVVDSQIVHSSDSWLHFDHVRVICVDLSKSRSSHLAIPWPGGKEVMHAEVPQGVSVPRRIIAGLELTGRLRRPPPVSIAAVASVRSLSGPILSAHIAYGKATMFGCGWTTLFAETSSEDFNVIRGYYTRGDGGEFCDLQPAPPDGSFSGFLDLEPSREVALETRQLDEFLDAALSFPVTVEIVTVEARSE